MTVMIGNARIAETGGIYGQPGDSTGREAMEQPWSTGGTWTEVFRPKSATAAAKIAKAMKQICANNNVGYSQSSSPTTGRTSLYNKAKAAGWKISKVGRCNTDCSAAVSVCVNAAGIPVSKDMYTGNESALLMGTGKFTRYTAASYTKSPNNLATGDILLRPGHTAIVTAGAVKRGTSKKKKETNKNSITAAAKKVLEGKYGNGTTRIKRLKAAGYTDAEIRKIQDKVNVLSKSNRITAAVEKVLAGKYGNGEERKKKLKAAGYSEKEIARIQALVNKKVN